jgi:excinuclease ABC subunit C
MVDGGKGQLGRAVKVLETFGLSERVPVVGLAKQQEELFCPNEDRSLILPRHSQGLYLVQRVRDEAHRFAITAHRKARGKIGIASRLDAIPGIGPKRRMILLEKFGDIEGIRHASLEELQSTPGITEEVAQALLSGLD